MVTAKFKTQVNCEKLEHDLLVVLIAKHIEEALENAGRDMGALLKAANLEKSLVRAYGLLLHEEAYHLVVSKFLSENPDVKAIYDGFKASTSEESAQR